MNLRKKKLICGVLNLEIIASLFPPLSLNWSYLVLVGETVLDHGGKSRTTNKIRDIVCIYV